MAFLGKICPLSRNDSVSRSASEEVIHLFKNMVNNIDSPYISLSVMYNKHPFNKKEPEVYHCRWIPLVPSALFVRQMLPGRKRKKKHTKI